MWAGSALMAEAPRWPPSSQAGGGMIFGEMGVVMVVMAAMAVTVVVMVLKVVVVW